MIDLSAGPPPKDKPDGLCCWGYCFLPAVTWRMDETEGWLPVCDVHAAPATEEPR